jgi:hypothetical protein
MVLLLENLRLVTHTMLQLVENIPDFVKIVEVSGARDGLQNEKDISFPMM